VEGLHLHKHFPLDDGHLLISTAKLQDGQEVELARPMNAKKAGAVHPISFFVEADGTLRAYKFAPGFRALTEAEKRFSREGSSRLVSTGEYQRVSFKRPTSKGIPTTEFEIPSHKATVLFPQSYVKLRRAGPGEGDGQQGGARHDQRRYPPRVDRSTRPCL
jgi:hypothetical protein